MRVYAFVGPSGTGKSYRAQWIARENNLECIIDDGLLIKNNKVLAGSSAKKEANKVASVKRAVFVEDEHRKSVITAIKNADVQGILILGTSDGMVEKIVTALNLPPIEKIIRIEDVATAGEIEKARYMRREMGKHVIPVPTIEVKKQFSGYFLNPLKIFRTKGKGQESFEAEKTIVRPTFSYMGEYTISEKVINSLIYNIGVTIPSIQRMLRIKNKNTYDGVIIDVDLSVYYMKDISKSMEDFAEKIVHEIEHITALNIVSLNINVKGIYMI